MADFTIYDGPSEEWLKIEATLPPRPHGENMRDSLAIRATANQGREEASAAAFAHMRDRLIVKDHRMQTRDGFGLEARTYRPREVPETEVLPVYLHLHGGGFIFGTLASEDASCGRIALSLASQNQNMVVLNVNYRHTPEWKYPTSWDDAVDAWVWLHANLDQVGGDGENVILGGVSAGARLAASLVVRKYLGVLESGQELPDPKGLVLLIPSLVHQNCHGPLYATLKDPNQASNIALKDAPIVPQPVLKWFSDLLAVEEPHETDVKLNPGNIRRDQLEKNKPRFPPTVFGIAGYDPLRDDGLMFAKNLAEAGIPTKAHLFYGVPHGFRRFGDQLSACKKWDSVIDGGIVWCLSGPEATGRFDVVVE
ncbi:putative lipase/esterase [Sporormia fimetaria CBS 119925]|uniref:Lipase/esterase n=1 Tax=Sporormia fimetaria CBS 119925 TaxID=1340428 RepID=A0A6A6V2D6_9PLEO|nr:putative lipase/esterase [Sporormia fimetaria CBS 119925]